MEDLNIQEVEPIDPEQCQAEQRMGSFMTLGPRPMKRCENSPVYFAVEKKEMHKGLGIGAMSLCSECAKIMTRKMGDDYAYLFKLKEIADGQTKSD